MIRIVALYMLVGIAIGALTVIDPMGRLVDRVVTQELH